MKVKSRRVGAGTCDTAAVARYKSTLVLEAPHGRVSKTEPLLLLCVLLVQ